METSRVQRSVLAEHCQSRSAYTELTGKWVGLALIALEPNTSLRFSEIRRKVEGISERLLSQVLQLLEQDGLVSREVISNTPPHVEYSLTQNGEKVREPIRALATTLEALAGEIASSRTEYQAKKSA